VSLPRQLVATSCRARRLPASSPRGRRQAVRAARIPPRATRRRPRRSCPRLQSRDLPKLSSLAARSRVSESEIDGVGLTEEKANKEDRLQPSKGLSAYNLFCKERVTKLREEKGISAVEAFKLVGAEWATLSAEKKIPYENLSKQDELR